MNQETPNIYGQLSAVQLKLKAPKSLHNSFGNYNYRSAEDILEAVKPILNEEDLVLIISDSLKQIGDRYYVEATATVYNASNDSLSATAYAREAEDKKGMDASQITGSTSSYARKYALNGLFNIDDTKDADSFDNRSVKKNDKGEKYVSADEVEPTNLAANYTLNSIREQLKKMGYDDVRIEATVKQYSIKTSEEAKDYLAKLKKYNEMNVVPEDEVPFN